MPLCAACKYLSSGQWMTPWKKGNCDVTGCETAMFLRKLGCQEYDLQMYIIAQWYFLVARKNLCKWKYYNGSTMSSILQNTVGLIYDIYMICKIKCGRNHLNTFKLPVLRTLEHSLRSHIVGLPPFQLSNESDGDKIGQGSFGPVSLAMNQRTSEKVVVKRLFLLRELKKRKSLFKESRPLQKLQRKNVVEF